MNQGLIGENGGKLLVSKVEEQIELGFHYEMPYFSQKLPSYRQFEFSSFLETSISNDKVLKIEQSIEEIKDKVSTNNSEMRELDKYLDKKKGW